MRNGQARRVPRSCITPVRVPGSGCQVAEVAAATLPTLSVAALAGDLKDTEKPGKDSLKVTASCEFIAGEWAGGNATP